MRFHVINDGKTFYEGTSLAVAQFVELVRGERDVQQPHNLFRVREVAAEEHYCFQCFGVRWFDAIYARHPLWKTIKRCRCCGKEVFG